VSYVWLSIKIVKKEEKKGIEIGAILIIFLLALAIVPSVLSFISKNFGPSSAGYFEAYYPTLVSVLQHVFGWLVGISIIVSVLLLVGIVTAVEGIRHVRRKEAELYDLKVEEAYDDNIKGDPTLTKKWTNVMSHVDSPNASDWRQAIIEADIILGEILTKMGYHGDSIGDQLKGATLADFNTLEQAWEAHKVRNQIAHQGSDFALGQHEAKRVVNLYRQVFEEFFYI